MRRIIFIAFGLGAFTVSGCASTGAVPSPFPRPGHVSRPSSPLPDSATDESRTALIGTALSLRGVPYRDGGADPTGFDCSGFVAYVFAQRGHLVPRTVSEQYEFGSAVPRAVLEAGDLVFFSTTAPGASHVGIAISDVEFVHAPSSTGVVRVESLTAPYWASRFVGARRLP